MRILSNQSRHFVLLSSVILALGGCAHAELKPGNCGALASLEVECVENFVDSNFALLSEAVFPSLTGLVIMLLAWEGYKLFYGRSVADGLTNSVILMIKYAVIMALFGSASLVDEFQAQGMI